MVGKKIQHYEILHELGEGGMGKVYEAEDARLGRHVAIKVLPEAAVADAKRVERFKREAQTASALNHPSIVTIYDILDSGNLHCIVMELIQGQTLGEWMHGGTSLDDSAAVAAQIARALIAAHEAGIIHRDIKPDNIMIRDDGIVKILDFGLAKLIDHSRLTRDGAVVGTVSHMSPEQALGNDINDRTDIWALGVVLYEMLAGETPFKADNEQAILFNIINSNAKLISEVVPSIPAKLGTMVMRMLEKDAQLRPDAREVNETLSQVSRNLTAGSDDKLEIKTATVTVQHARNGRLWTARDNRRAVAVLPFKILSGGTDYDFLGLALAEAVSHALSSNPELIVRPTSAVVRYVQNDVDPMDVGRHLSANVVVEGSIQALGNGIRVQAQAWDASEGSTLLSVKLDGNLDDLFGLQDRLADKLGESMGFENSGTASERPTRNAESYELFLRANESFLRYDKAGMRRAIEMLRKAVALDPKFADAWSRLAAVLVYMAAIIDPQIKWYDEAETAVARALTLDSANAEAWAARGRIQWSPHRGFQHAHALRDLNKACCQPSYPADAPLWRGIVLSHIGLHDEGLDAISEARESQPDDMLAALTFGETLGWSGDLNGNLEIMKEVLAREPAFPFGHLFMPVPLLYLERLEEAEAAIRAGKKILGEDAMILASEALLWAKRGEHERSRKTLQQVFQNLQSVSHTHHTYHYAAAAYASIGDLSQAAATLRQSAQAGLPNYPAFKNDPHFAALRDHTDFVDFMSGLKAGLNSYRAEFGK